MSAASAGTPILGSTASPPRNVSGPARSASVVAGSRSSFDSAVAAPIAVRLTGTAGGSTLGSALMRRTVRPVTPHTSMPCPLYAEINLEKYLAYLRTVPDISNAHLWDHLLFLCAFWIIEMFVCARLG